MIFKGKSTINGSVWYQDDIRKPRDGKHGKTDALFFFFCFWGLEGHAARVISGTVILHSLDPIQNNIRFAYHYVK